MGGREMNNKGFAVLAVMGAAAISTVVSMAIFEIYIWVKEPEEKVITVTEEQITPEKAICVGEL